MLRAQEKLYQQERKLRMGEKDYSFGNLRFILQNPQLPLWILSFAWAFFFMADFQSKKMYGRHERDFDIEIVRVIELPM